MDKNLMILIGQKIKQLRVINDYSLQDVAIRIGKSRKSVHAYEKGIVDISVSTLKSILDIYGVELGNFLDSL